MIELGSRQRTLPAPPRIVFSSLTEPHQARARPWLTLRPDEVEPRVLVAEEPHRVAWSSLWPDRHEDEIWFDLAQSCSATALRWTWLTPGDPPHEAEVRSRRHRLNHLFFADLRFSYGQ